MIVSRIPHECNYCTQQKLSREVQWLEGSRHCTTARMVLRPSWWFSAALLASLAHFSLQSTPAQPYIPSNFAATWLFTCPPYNFSMVQSGWLGDQGLSGLVWRLDSLFPLLNRTEVYQRVSNGTEIKGSVWYATSTDPAVHLNHGNAVLGPDSGSVTAPSPMYVCSPNVTTVGIDGLKLDWVSNFATTFTGIDTLNGVACQHWNLLLFTACYDIWITSGYCKCFPPESVFIRLIFPVSDDVKSVPIRFTLSEVIKQNGSQPSCGSVQKQFDYHQFSTLSFANIVSAATLPTDCPELCPTLPSASPRPTPRNNASWLLFGLVVAASGLTFFVIGWVLHRNRIRTVTKQDAINNSLMDVLE